MSFSILTNFSIPINLTTGSQGQFDPTDLIVNSVSFKWSFNVNQLLSLTKTVSIIFVI